ncbi:hypothetical protein FB451DRAFT_1372589 [Mycena latifolia]|nr:hypothetical protein FB451DRAFT_1372589 [Mycena latifolia]
MSAALLVLLSCGLRAIAHSIGAPVATWDVNAPTMDGWIQYQKFDTSADSRDQSTQGWVPMNTTGSTVTGNLYTPFYNFDGDVTRAGWRLAGDEASEVVYMLKDNYSGPNASYVAGSNTGWSSFITTTHLTYLDAPAAAARDVWSNGTFADLPFTTHIVSIGKESTDNGSNKCAQPWNFTATVVTADGTTSSSAVDRLEVAVPPNTASTITLTNAFDPKFSALLSFSADTPLLYSRGSSARIGNVTLEQKFFITFCPEDD